MVRRPQDCSSGNSHTRCDQPSSRRSLPREASDDRVGAEGIMCASSLQPLWAPQHRPLCLGQERQTADILHEVSRGQSMGDRCPVHQLAGSGCVHFPPSESHSQGHIQSQVNRQLQTSIDSPVLAQAAMVPDIIRPSHRLTQTPLAGGGSTHTGTSVPSGSQVPASGCVENIRLGLRQKGLSLRAAQLAPGSRRTSRVATYDARLAKFKAWCAIRDVSPSYSPSPAAADFLTTLFDGGLQVNTIQNYRSAISAIHQGFEDGSLVGDNSALAQLIKAVSIQRPIRRVLAPLWSMNAVLRTLADAPYEPLHKASLEHLTVKTLFLVAAVTPRRRSCIQALTTKPGHIRFEPHGVRLVPDLDFLPKNQTLDFVPGDLFIPTMSSGSSITEDKVWCPVRSLKWHLHRTESLRQSQRLFILPRRTHSPASKTTISRLLVDLVAPHALSRPRAHDIRGLATSRALFAGANLSDILKAGAW